MHMKAGLMSISVSAAILAACAQQQATDPAIIEVSETSPTPSSNQVKLAPPMTTIKPGASVTFSLDEAKPIASGANGTVTLTVNEGYPSGVLYLKASGGSGLNVFGAERLAQKDMASGTSHTWRIDYAADADGVYLINILATAEPEPGFKEMRAHSVRVKIGDWQTAQAKSQAARKTQTLPDGERATILEAQETVE
ncbi:MAG: hypothetical protein NXH88_16725 [Hyphomonas sp.]|nr:hypothetical protein [Hyphomonas sp.]